VGPSVAINKVKENYNIMMKGSLTALYHLQGPGNNAGDPSSAKLKRPKIVEVPKFDVNKPGMQTFLNSMALVTKSYKFDCDKDLAQFDLNNLTEASKTLIFAIYPLDDKSFYESSAAVIKYLESFISPNIRINALRDIRVLKMENGGLQAYYKSFTRLVSDLGSNSMNQESLVLYFIAGLNPNAVRNTNLNLHMHNFLDSHSTATITNLYAEADKVISLAGTNSGGIGMLGKRAGPDRGEPRPQQRDRGYTQRPSPQQSQQTPSNRFQLTCTRCHNCEESVL
jgi:hypothetical protein